MTIVEGALDTGRIPEGNSIKLLCTSNANPSDVAYQWYMNDEQIVDATLNELVIFVIINPCEYLRRINRGNSRTKSDKSFHKKIMVFVLQEIFNVTRRYQNSVVKCQAQNIVGSGGDSTTLDVICTYFNKRAYEPRRSSRSK